LKPVVNDGPERLEKSVEIGTLCAFYGGLLTQRQQDALRLHYEEDLSLGEIADELEVSRQNVHELITRSVQKLRRYEEALGAMRRAEETAKVLRQVQSLIGAADTAPAEAHATLMEASRLIDRLIRQQEGEDNEPWPLKD